MQGYRYQHGDRPLDGYTIERAVGRGGFGEVYYAVSDGGREVALKAVQGYEQIELRGVRQCMNLKSPHLVTIFDIRHNDSGQWFVIMEYVAGPSLRDLIAQSPGGLGPAKSAYLFREIAKGLSFLHDAGIVHRDLKPGNIFYEDGVVKIGDYGLSKAIAPSRHEGQTITVGTVHYMAPEIGAGCYDRSIDIYALGVVLYEMLTGNVPFAGSSHGEILMKHMTAQPDLSGVDEPIAGVIRKALAKDPHERYATVPEMVESLFGSEELRQSVSAFLPASLTMAAGRVAGRLGERPARVGSGSPAQPPPIPPAGARVEPPPQPPRRKVVSVGASGIHVHKPDGSEVIVGPSGVHVTRADGREVHVGAGGVRMRHGHRASDTTPPRTNGAMTGADPLTRRQRIVLAMVAVGTVAVAVGMLTSPAQVRKEAVVTTALSILAGVVGLRVALRLWPLEGPSERLIRLAYRAVAAGATTGLGAFLVGTARQLNVQWLPLFVALLLVDWPRQVDPRRAERVSLGQAIWAAALGLVAGLVFGNDLIFPIAVAGGLSLVVQVLFPYWGASAAATARDASAAAAEEPSMAAAAAKERSPAASAPAPSPAAVAGPPPLGVSSDPVSTRRRLPALFLALLWVLGLGGLHRFYVGKIATGLLWLGTWGLLGVGQLVDIILILTGHFRDRRGRPLVVWENWAELDGRVGGDGRPLQRGDDFSVTLTAPAPVNAFLSAAGGTLLLTAVTLVPCALVTSQMMAAGFFDAGLPAFMKEQFGDRGWPNIMDNVCQAVAIGLGLIGALLLILARRSAGAGHVIRVFWAAAGLYFACTLFRGALRSIPWRQLANQPSHLARVLTLLVKNAHQGPALAGALVLLASMTILAWPPRPRAILPGQPPGRP